MSVLLAFSVNDNSYVIVLDASLRELHGASSEVPEHNVEKGANVSDHVRPRQPTVRIDGLISNTPIFPSLTAKPPFVPSGNFSGSVQPVTASNPKGLVFAGGMGLQFPQSFDRVRDVSEALYAAQAAGVLISVDTSLRHYNDMAIEHLDFPREARDGSALRFSISVKKINFVSTQVVESRAPLLAKVSKGNKVTKKDNETTTEQKKKNIQSVAFKAAH